jgi:hypothetical protein
MKTNSKRVFQAAIAAVAVLGFAACNADENAGCVFQSANQSGS